VNACSPGTGILHQSEGSEICQDCIGVVPPKLVTFEAVPFSFLSSCVAAEMEKARLMGLLPPFPIEEAGHTILLFFFFFSPYYSLLILLVESRRDIIEARGVGSSWSCSLLRGFIVAMFSSFFSLFSTPFFFFSQSHVGLSLLIPFSFSFFPLFPFDSLRV